MSLAVTLYGLVKTLVGAEVLVFADQNAPRPSLPYWSMRLSARRTLGRDAYGQGADVNGDQTVHGVRELTLQVQRYGEGSIELVADFQDLLSKVTVQEAWVLQKVAAYNIGDVMNVPYGLDNTQLEPRASVDVFVRVGTELLDNVGLIENVEVGAGYVTDQTLGFDGNPDLAEVINVVL